MTDEAGYYRNLGLHFAGHGFTSHGKGQYVDYENPLVHTNTIEGAFSIFKRGMKGVYQHCAKKPLHRYLAEFDFRDNNRVATGVNDAMRPGRAMGGMVGRRTLYQLSQQSSEDARVEAIEHNSGFRRDAQE